MIDTSKRINKKFHMTPIPMNLTFFKEGQGGEKTEKATPKKREKARKEGQVAQSQEVGTALLLVAAFVGLRAFAPMILNRVSGLMMVNFSSINNFDNMPNISDPTIAARLIWTGFGQVILTILPLALVVMGVGLAANIMQVGWKPTGKPLKPKFSKLNPLKGIKKVFSLKIFLELVKSLLKFAVIIIAIYFVVVDRLEMLLMLMHVDLFEAVFLVADLIATIGITIGVLYIFIAAIDYAFNRRKHEKELRMSKQEVKEEWKQMEGDPLIKSRIKQKMREVSMRRMMQEVPTADVVITNPTHFACALRYDRERGGAPILVAKGKDNLAARIKDTAKENFVVIVEDKPLARTIYNTVDIGEEIPPELWQAVAEVLAYVYRLKTPALA